MLLAGASGLPAIDTPRLLLRSIGVADVPALFDIFGDAEVCRYWSHSPLRNLEAAAELQRGIARHFAERTLFQWAIVERHTAAVVGTGTLASISAEHRRAELGFALARGAWGQGYIAEVMPAIIGFAFDTLALHRIEADVDPRNARSIRALEREGFQREGCLRARYHVAGEMQDAVLFGLLRDDWRAGDRQQGYRGCGPGADAAASIRHHGLVPTLRRLHLERGPTMAVGSRTMLVILLAGAASAACRQAPAPRRISSDSRSAVMDSAEVERLCASPDSVRAGTAACVLRNQGRPPRTRPRP